MYNAYGCIKMTRKQIYKTKEDGTLNTAKEWHFFFY